MKDADIFDNQPELQKAFLEFMSYSSVCFRVPYFVAE
jgi:hypothetical protein